MEWSERLNSAIDYIEDNLTGHIDITTAAQKALCSDFHFQRMFNVVTGITPGEYIRRRRMTLAAVDLLSGNTKVLIIALKYGYESPEAFSRAFKSVHKITPLAARTRGIQLASYPCLSFRVSVTGDTVINYKIIQKPAFDVVGKVKKFPSAEGKGPAQFWADFSSSKESAVLQAFSRGFAGPFTGGYMLGVAHDVFKEDFKYAIAVEKTSEAVPEGFEVIHIAESAWAIFEVIGHMPHAIFQVALRIYTEWLPSTGYKSTGRMELEVYFNRANYCQIWVPLVMKKDHSGISVVKLSAAPCLFQGAVHGNWIAGSSSEPVSGSFKLTIDADSSVLGSFKGDFTGIIEGRVDNEGQLVATATTANVDIAQMVLKVTGQLTISGNALNITGLFESDKLRRYFSGTGNVFSMEYRFPKRGKKKI